MNVIISPVYFCMLTNLILVFTVYCGHQRFIRRNELYRRLNVIKRIM